METCHLRQEKNDANHLRPSMKLNIEGGYKRLSSRANLRPHPHPAIEPRTPTMDPGRLVTLTYSALAAAAIVHDDAPFRYHEPLRLILIVDMTWTDTMWSIMYPLFFRDPALRSDLQDIAYLFGDFRRLQQDDILVRAIHFKNDINDIAIPAINIMKSMQHMRSEVRSMVSRASHTANTMPARFLRYTICDRARRLRCFA